MVNMSNPLVSYFRGHK